MRSWTALSGAAFALLFALAASLYGGGAGSDAADIRAYYSRPASWRHQEYGFAVLLVACLLLLHYVAVLRARLTASDPSGTVLMLGGAATVVLLMTANALWAATAFTVEIQRSASFVDPAAHVLMEDAAFALVVTAAAAAIPMVIVTCLHAQRRGDLPRWFVALGWLAVVGLAAAYWYFPLLPFLLWIVAGSLLLSRRRRGTVDGHPDGETIGAGSAADRPGLGQHT
jgi:hypothetical protein